MKDIQELLWEGMYMYTDTGLQIFHFRCSSGFYGYPSEPGSTCRRCECGGGPCDELTGQCLRCRGNTEGWRCEKCLPNHYGDPGQADCKRKFKHINHT